MKTIMKSWGYFCIDNDVVWIPFIKGDLKSILREIYEATGIKRMIFSVVLNPRELKMHLKNVVREWDEWWERIEDYSHCIEIEYIP